MLNVEQQFSKSGQEWQNLIQQAQAAWQKGDFEQYGDLVTKLQEVSKGFLMIIARSKLPAYQVEDCVAETYVDLIEYIDKGETIHNVKALLRTIINRRIVDIYRKKGNTIVVSGDNSFWEQHAETTPSQDSLSSETIEAKETAFTIANTILNVLPPLEREILITRHMEGLTVAETALRLDITEDQVKKLTQKAMIHSKQIVKERELSDDII